MYQKIASLSKFLGDKEWFIGHLTWADFIFTFTARFVDAVCYSLLGNTPFADFPNLDALMERVSDLPGIKERLDAAQVLPYVPADRVPFKLLKFKEMIEMGLNPL